MKRSLGLAVLVGVFALIFGYTGLHWPGDTKFDCGRTGAATAHANTTDCPANLGQAMSDAPWAAARIAAINAEVAANPNSYTKKYTHGELYEQDGTAHWYDSGQDADADSAEQVGRALRVFGPVGRVAATEHVEVKVSARMRTANVTQAVLVINNPGGPCGVDEDEPGVFRCAVVVPKILPAGASLTVWWPGRTPGTAQVTTYHGGYS
jgi:archaellum component FlaG (FlaF/FlaG flagellin family)